MVGRRSRRRQRILRAPFGHKLEGLEVEEGSGSAKSSSGAGEGQLLLCPKKRMEISSPADKIA